VDHQTEVKYEGGLEKLITDIGDLRYDALEAFLRDLSLKLRLDGCKDRTRGRVLLSIQLENAANKLLDAAAYIGIAWDISEPHMREDDGDGRARGSDEDVRADGVSRTLHAVAAGDGAD